jgi:hypothetical protein
VFKFTHPDPEKIWRLLRRWSNGHAWSKDEMKEFRLLVKEWFVYYMFMGNVDEARKIKKKWAQVMKESSNRKCMQTTTPGDVRYASRKSKTLPETCL